MPKLGSIEYLDQTTVDLGAPYSELDSEFACEDNPLETKSKSKSGRKTKSNHKSKSTKRKKRRVEVDDSRPESDQNLFERIQATKYLARLAGRKPLSALHPTDMATGTRNRRANDDPNEEYLGQSQPREQGSLSLANMTPEDRKIFDEELEKILLCDKKLSKDARSV